MVAHGEDHLSPAMRCLELRLPPPVVVLIWAIAMAALAWAWPEFSFPVPGRTLLALALAALGIGLGGAGVIAFRKAQTTVNPVRPHQASCIVSHGVFAYTRNPMYLGLFLVLLGWALFLANPLPFAMLPLFIAYMTRFQIIPEERHLQEKFGAPYTTYLQSVRRWL